MVSTKHIVNDPKSIVLDALKGVVALNPKVTLNEEYKIVHLKNIPDQVSIISGGGSGHEPSHTGFVGTGLLSAAVSGNVFASPNTNQVKKALDLVHNDKGTLIVIMQYTGDVLHFGLAKEQFTALNPNAHVRLLAVGEDVAVGREQGKMVGRRGMAGTVLVYKVAGALAKLGSGLDDVYRVGQFVADRTATIGVGLEHCDLPGTASTESHLAPDEMELGMGIHNEPGLQKIPLPKTKALLDQMITFATSTTDADRSFVPFKADGADEVVLMVNNLGGISQLEFSGIVGNAMDVAAEKGLKVKRVLAGTYMTSLDMPGFSISLFLLPREGESAYSAEQLLSLVDAPGDAPGWAWNAALEPVIHIFSSPSSNEERPVKNTGARLPPTSTTLFLSAIRQACEDIIAAEPDITRYDTIAGDGDCGTCLKAGGQGILAALDKGEVDGEDVIGAVLTLAENIEREMDGTSGALYSIFFNALASGLRTASENQTARVAGKEVWAEAVSLAKQALFQYTRARAPSRTLVDPLEAFVAAFSSDPAGFGKAVEAAVGTANETAKIEAKAGRAAYVGREELSKANVPDPGAWGLAILLQGIQKILQA